ncbi:hypothetical protein PybrP1_001171, partial [[Pythium] brassicae (nom. inval.)]
MIGATHHDVALRDGGDGSQLLRHSAVSSREGDPQLSGCGYEADASSLDASSLSRRRKSPRTRRRQALGACVQSMKGQVAFMQHLVRRQVALGERTSLVASSKHECDRSGDPSDLSFSLLSPVRRTDVDLDARPDAHVAKRLLFQEEAWGFGNEASRTRNSSGAESAAVARAAELERENSVLKEQMMRQGEHTNETVADLLDEIETLKRAARAREEETARLRAEVQRLTRQAANDQACKSVLGGVESSASAGDRISDHTGSKNQIDDQALSRPKQEDAQDELETSDKHAGHAREKPAEVAVAHIGHERCQSKIHELWQTVKNLKVYVEMYRVESIDLKTQRDEAVASAERAWKDNAKLAGNANPQAKIKYVQAVKDENVVLARKIRELQSRLAAQQAKRAAKRASTLEPHESSQSDISSSLDESVVEPLDPLAVLERDSSGAGGSEPERSKLFRKMWQHNKELEAEIERLRCQKRELAARRPRFVPTASSNASTPTASKWAGVTTRSGTGPGQSRTNGASGRHRHLPNVASLVERAVLGATVVALRGSAPFANAKDESPTRAAQPSSSGGDSPLPTGWQRVTHDSGLTCYVHEQQRLVCWSKPYVLDLLCSPGEFVDVARQHTFEEFKTLPIGDPRILQACAELSYKTPAQVLQEYQNRNRGISINYNTHSIDQDG